MSAAAADDDSVPATGAAAAPAATAAAASSPEATAKPAAQAAATTTTTTATTATTTPAAKKTTGGGRPPRLVGLAGARHIRTTLPRQVPAEFISAFQQQHGLDSPASNAALPLLDLHDVPRAQLYKTIVQSLRERLLQRIESGTFAAEASAAAGSASAAASSAPASSSSSAATAAAGGGAAASSSSSSTTTASTPATSSSSSSAKRASAAASPGLEVLLSKTFQYLQVEELRAIPLAVLKRHPAIPKVYLQRLLTTPELYEMVPIEVKRQIWLLDSNSFTQAIKPLMERREAALQAAGPRNLLQAVDPKARRQADAAVQELTQLIGSSLKLYNMVLRWVRAQYAQCERSDLCSLRSDLLMAIHDNEIADIYEADPCHKFAWCLSACARFARIDAARSREMEAELTAFGTNSPIFGDIAMILADDVAVGCIARSIAATLEDVVDASSLPCRNEDLPLLCRLLDLSTKAHSMIKSRAFHAGSVDQVLVHEFFPILSAIMVDERLARLSAEKQRVAVENSGEDGEDDAAAAATAAAAAAHAYTRDPLPAKFVAFVQGNICARRIAEYYLLHRATAGDLDTVAHVLPAFSPTPNSHSMLQCDGPFLHSFAHALVAHCCAAVVAAGIDGAVFSHLFLPFARLSAAAHLQTLEFLLRIIRSRPESFLLVEQGVLACAQDGRIAADKSESAGHTDDASSAAAPAQTPQGVRFTALYTALLQALPPSSIAAVYSTVAGHIPNLPSEANLGAGDVQASSPYPASMDTS